MRRVLLAAVLAAPALAAAQSSGQVVNGTTRSTGEIVADDQYINIDECLGAADSGIGPLELLWNAKLASGTVNGGAFKIYAASEPPVATEPRYCATQDNTTASPQVFAGQVGGDVPANVGQTTENADVPTADIASAATDEATFSCDDPIADRTITVCVHYFASNGSGGLEASPSGWAVGSLILSLRRPPPPPSTGFSVQGGEGALEVNWDAAPDPGSSEATATGYRVVVSDPATSGEVTFVDVTDTRARVEGLENGKLYDVAVYSLSAAKNQSATAVEGEGTPQETSDFWEYYRQAGGVEQGGCAAGGAGPLALLGLAGLLAALRRRS